MLKVGQLVKLGFEREPCEDTGVVITAPEPYWDGEGDPTYVNVHWQITGKTLPEFEDDLVPYDPEKNEFITSVDFRPQPW